MTTIKLHREAFNTKQVCAITGVSRKQIVHWDERGIVMPSLKSAAGRGSKRLYSYHDLLALRMVKRLRDLGISLQKIRRCVRYLRKHLADMSQPLNFCTLVTDGQTIQLVEDEQTLIDTVKRPGQRAWAQLSVADLDHELRTRVIRMMTKRVEEVTVGDETYQVRVEPDEECGGFVAVVPGLPGCISDGDTLQEALDMVRDAIECWLSARDELRREGIEVPLKARRKQRKKA